jgi:hypothetical protein
MEAGYSDCGLVVRPSTTLDTRCCTADSGGTYTQECHFVFESVQHSGERPEHGCNDERQDAGCVAGVCEAAMESRGEVSESRGLLLSCFILDLD